MPVMNKSEYEAIMEALERKAQAPGDMAYNRASRESARRLLPLVHFMGTYGLRIGDVLTVSVKLEEGDRFSYRQKGGEVRQKALRPISQEILSKNGNMNRQPFKDIAKSSVQGALRKLTLELSACGLIRYAYSCHDLRHYYAVSLYQETGDVYAVKESLGHANVAATEVYLAGLGAVRDHGSEGS